MTVGERMTDGYQHAVAIITATIIEQSGVPNLKEALKVTDALVETGDPDEIRAALLGLGIIARSFVEGHAACVGRPVEESLRRIGLAIAARP